MTLNELAYNIAGIAGKVNDPEFVERIKFSILYYRALFIRRDLETQMNNIPPQIVQTFCVDMEVSSGSVCCIGIDIGCTIYKSVEKLPKHINVKHNRPYLYVGTIDRMVAFASVIPGELNYMSYNTFTAKAPRFFIENDYLFVVNKSLKKVALRGIFEDPRDISKYDCTVSDCVTDDDEFPMALEMGQRITQAIMAGELQSPGGDTNQVEIDE